MGIELMTSVWPGVVWTVMKPMIHTTLLVPEDKMA